MIGIDAYLSLLLSRQDLEHCYGQDALTLNTSIVMTALEPSSLLSINHPAVCRAAASHVHTSTDATSSVMCGVAVPQTNSGPSKYFVAWFSVR